MLQAWLRDATTNAIGKVFRAIDSRPTHGECATRSTHPQSRVQDDEKASPHIQDRYTAFAFLSDEVENLCRQHSDHTQYEDHGYECLFPVVGYPTALSLILDGALAHLVDDTHYFDEGALHYAWVYCIDWDRKTIRLEGKGPAKEVGFSEVDAEWMAAYQAADEAFERAW